MRGVSQETNRDGSAQIYRAWLGRPKAITAMVRILWHLLKFKQPFNPELFAKEEAKIKPKQLARLETMAPPQLPTHTPTMKTNDLHG